MKDTTSTYLYLSTCDTYFTNFHVWFFPNFKVTVRLMFPFIQPNFLKDAYLETTKDTKNYATVTASSRSF